MTWVSSLLEPWFHQRSGKHRPLCVPIGIVGSLPVVNDISYRPVRYVQNSAGEQGCAVRAFVKAS